MKVSRDIAEVTRYNNVLEDLPIRKTYKSTERHSIIYTEVLVDRFGIGIKRAKATLRGKFKRGA